MRILCLLVIVNTFLVSQENPLSLKECVDMGFNNSVELKIAVENLAQAELNKKKYFAPFLPSLDFAFSNTLLGFDDLGRDIVLGMVNPHTYNSTVSLTYNFYNMFKDQDRYSYYQRKFAEAELAFASKKQEIAYGIISYYFEVLDSKKTLQVRQKALEQKKEYLKLAESLFRSGIKSKADYLNAQIQIKKSEVSLLDSENDLKALRAGLNTRLGLPPEKETGLLDDIEYSRPEYSLEKLIQAVFKNNFDWRRALEGRNAAFIAASLEERNLWPSVSIDGSYSLSLNQYLLNNSEWTHAGRLDQNTVWGIGLTVAYPLFDGGVKSIKYELARSALAIEDYGIEALRKDLLEKTFTSYNNIIKVAAELGVYKEQVSLAKETMELIKNRYQSGISSFLDLTDAELNYISAEIGYYQMIYSYKTQKFNIDRLSGVELFW